MGKGTCTFTLEYRKDGEWIVGRLLEYPGVCSQGKTMDELMENIKDAFLAMKASEQQPVRNAVIHRYSTREVSFAI